LTVRVGVVGGGLVAQAAHLPYLSALRDRFTLAALAEPSRTVREALGARYGIAGLHADYRAMLDAGGLDAVVVCSPAGTHAEIVLGALDAGVHVFVEKPMCITLADADAIVAERDRAGKVVQVGTMKRYDPAVEAMLEGGVACRPGERFGDDPAARRFLRMAFLPISTDELDRGIAILGKALAASSR